MDPVANANEYSLEAFLLAGFIIHSTKHLVTSKPAGTPFLQVKYRQTSSKFWP
jgi:hypothetical protein